MKQTRKENSSENQLILTFASVMQRYAAHYIFMTPETIYKQHFIELDENSCIRGVLPLDSELSGTEFHNGILFPIAKEITLSPEKIREKLVDLYQIKPEASVFELLNELQLVESGKGVPVTIYQLDGIDLLTTKFGTSNGRCNGYVQRL